MPNNRPLLVVTPNYKGEVIKLAQAAGPAGWDVVRCSNNWKVPSCYEWKRGVPYGEQYFCEKIAEDMNWNLYQNSFSWLAGIPQFFLKRKVEFMTLAEALQIRDTELKFIKPADDKCFPAGIYKGGNELRERNKLIRDEGLSNLTPVLVSDVVEWESEFRCVVKHRVATTWSCYSYNGEIDNPDNYRIDDPHFFVNSLLSYVDCAPGSIIDVGKIRGRGWAVLETNPIWAAGIYGCDLDKFLEALAASCYPIREIIK